MIRREEHKSAAFFFFNWFRDGHCKIRLRSPFPFDSVLLLQIKCKSVPCSPNNDFLALWKVVKINETSAV